MRPVDNDKLIACVLSKPAIWDKREKIHSSRTLVDKCWKKIAGEMDVDENTLRKKWKYLREQFCVELGKTSLASSGDEGPNPESTRWPYFRSLMFLKEVVKPRLSSSNTSNNSLLNNTVPVDPGSFPDGNAELKEDTLEEGCPDDLGSEAESAHSQQEAQIQPIRTLLTSRKRAYPSEIANSYDIENKRQFKGTDDKEQCDEEELLFFRSLLPHVRNVHPARKLLLRSKILEVVSEFVYSKDTIHSHSNPTKH